MPDVETITTGPGKVTTKWYSSILTPQTVVMICAGFVAVVIFWKTSKDNWDKVRQQEELIKNKADKAETEAKIKAMSDQLNRQYERFSKVDDKITILEKQREYDNGYREGEREEKRDQRRKENQKNE